jgi:hypothetical protein
MLIVLNRLASFRDMLPVGDVWFGNSEHVDGGLVESDENAVVNLPQAEQLQAFADFRVDTVDTRIDRNKNRLENELRIEKSLSR